MRYFAQSISVAIFLAVVVLPCQMNAKDPASIAPEAVEFFEKRIRPVLVQNCYECHSAEVDEPEGGLRLDTRPATYAGGDSGPAIVPGNVEKSLLLAAIRYTDDFYPMPPQGKLPDAVIADFARWVEMGATDPRGDANGDAVATEEKAEIDWDQAREFWAFQPPVEPVIPVAQDPSWCRSPLDRFILAELEANGLRPAPPASRRDWIRRATYDLTGLPPKPNEIEAFLNDESPEAHARVVERLLASPRYGEKWGRHWLDVARYADSNGLDENLAYVNAYHYRDYVIRAFNDDKPYDRFVQEQLAGDLLPASRDETEQQRHDRLIATGLLSLGPKMLACDDPQKMELDIIDEQVDTTGRAFMGMTMGCARCHDHKFDPLPTADYYALAGIFKSTKTMENFRVVAKWHEYSIATKEQEDAAKADDQRTQELEQEIEARTSAANEEFLNEERHKAGTYLASALRFIEAGEIRPDGKLPVGELVHAEKLRGKGVLLEAEDFQRGTVSVDREKYGHGVGVAFQAGFAEYDIELPAAGEYHLEFRYAAEDSRPLTVLINGERVTRRAAAKTTGGWQPADQEWIAVGSFTLRAGKNVLRLERSSAWPHVDKILLLPISTGEEIREVADTAGDESPRPVTLKRLARDHGLRQPILRQWIGYLHSLDRHADPLWTAIETITADTNRRELSQRFDREFQENRNTESIESTDSPNTIGSAFRNLLYDPQGPYRLPRDAQRFHSEQAQSDLRRLAEAKNELEASRPTLPRAMGVTEGEIVDLPIHIRGNYLTLGEAAPRAVPRVFGSHAVPTLREHSSGRRELAEWLTQPDHPLTARVMANRIWLWHFGEGLVRTPDNFGALGSLPTNQALLDWLALRFVESGWSIKEMHRLIMLSATYRMSTRYDPVAVARDPGNKLWWRYPRRRLQAEEIRDSLLFLGGSLDMAMHGQLLPNKEREYVTGTASKEGNYDIPRRSIYLPILRSAVYNVLQAFDFPDPAVISGQRQSTTVAPQALFMMNGDLMLRESGRLASRLIDEAESDSQRVEQLHLHVLGRRPSADELGRCLVFVESYQNALTADDTTQAERLEKAWQGLCRVLLASNEFVYLN